MKNTLESLAVLLIGLLSLGIIYLIVLYNLVDDGDILDEIAYEIPQKKKVSTKAKATNYLQDLEGYEDVDVQVDATKENRVNTVIVQSEVKSDALGTAVEDKSKSSYMQNLANYADEAEEEKLDTTKPTDDRVGAPKTLDNQAVVDKAGMDMDDTIGSAVEDKSKSSYMKNLANYEDVAKKEKLDTMKPKDDGIGAPKTLENQAVVDKAAMDIGDDISSAVADKANKEKLDAIKPKDDDDPEKLDQEEIVDEVGMALDDLMSDI